MTMMDGYTVLHVETYEPNPTHEPGYEHVYVAIEYGKMSNYADGIIYAAKCPKQSVACIKYRMSVVGVYERQTHGVHAHRVPERSHRHVCE